MILSPDSSGDDGENDLDPYPVTICPPGHVFGLDIQSQTETTDRAIFCNRF